ncbi:MAG: response regulator [Bacteroidia bacterium]|nr:response regulator [Bacteroidia bacterium]
MKKVLVIEDDPILRDNTVEFLKEEGFETFAAKDGAEGVQMALEIIPDIILCDISMPKMDGYEVFKTLQSIPSTSAVPFIFLTAKIQRDDIRLGMQLGVDDYITKPYSYDDLLTSIQVRLEKTDRITRSFDNKFMSLIENPLLGVFILQGEKFTYVNSRFVKILEFGSDKDVYSKGINDIVDEEFKSKFYEKIQLCQKGVYSSHYFRARLKTSSAQLIKVAVFTSSAKLKGVNSIIGYVLKESGNLNMEQIDECGSITEQITEAIHYFTKQQNVKPEELIKIVKANSSVSPMQNPDNLSKREIEIIHLMSLGLANKEIADKLFVSQRTIDSHKANILIKTGAKHTAALMIYAMKNNILENL